MYIVSSWLIRLDTHIFTISGRHNLVEIYRADEGTVRLSDFISELEYSMDILPHIFPIMFSRMSIFSFGSLSTAP